MPECQLCFESGVETEQVDVADLETAGGWELRNVVSIPVCERCEEKYLVRVD